MFNIGILLHRFLTKKEVALRLCIARFYYEENLMFNYFTNPLKFYRYAKKTAIKNPGEGFRLSESHI